MIHYKPIGDFDEIFFKHTALISFCNFLFKMFLFKVAVSHSSCISTFPFYFCLSRDSSVYLNFSIIFPKQTLPHQYYLSLHFYQTY
jgi:Na+/H+ antiporter NhaD/arsenite permease-like protein